MGQRLRHDASSGLGEGPGAYDLAYNLALAYSRMETPQYGEGPWTSQILRQTATITGFWASYRRWTSPRRR
jgi:hypothetical protein